MSGPEAGPAFRPKKSNLKKPSKDTILLKVPFFKIAIIS
jgi:hypothetical protein